MKIFPSFMREFRKKFVFLQWVHNKASYKMKSRNREVIFNIEQSYLRRNSFTNGSNSRKVKL
jgi:hypothetical protein